MPANNGCQCQVERTVGRDRLKAQVEIVKSPQDLDRIVSESASCED